MGGFGSGRQSFRRCAEDLLDLDIRKLKRDGLLAAWWGSSVSWSLNGQHLASIRIQSGEAFVRLTYQNRDREGVWKPMEYVVFLTQTKCNYGGERVWWLCPDCGRRVAVLYGGERFACRQCCNISYRSQREGSLDRAFRRAHKLRERLGWQPGLVNGDGRKPKGMHWRTFERLKLRHDAHANQSLVGMAAKLQLMSLRS